MKSLASQSLPLALLVTWTLGVSFDSTTVHACTKKSAVEAFSPSQHFEQTQGPRESNETQPVRQLPQYKKYHKPEFAFHASPLNLPGMIVDDSDSSDSEGMGLYPKPSDLERVFETELIPPLLATTLSYLEEDEIAQMKEDLDLNQSIERSQIDSEPLIFRSPSDLNDFSTQERLSIYKRFSQVVILSKNPNEDFTAVLAHPKVYSTSKLHLTGEFNFSKLDLSLFSKLESLILSINRIDDLNSESVQSLLKLPITSLEIRSGALIPSGIALAESLRDHPTLSKLALSSVAIESNLFKALLEVLSTLPHLESLSLTSVKLLTRTDRAPTQHWKLDHYDSSSLEKGEGWSAVSSFIKDTQSLRSLLLERNELTSQGMLSLSQALKDHSSIRSLSLSYNPLQDAGVDALLKGTGQNLRLSELNLVSTHMTDQGARIIRKVLENKSRLTHVDLDQNRFSTLAKSKLYKAARKCSRKTRLKLPATY